MSVAAYSLIALYVLAVVVLLLVVAMAMVRSLRVRQHRRAEKRAAPIRPILIRLVASDELDREALDMLGDLPDKEWRAVEPRVFAILDKVRGQAADSVATLLNSRGAADRTLRAARSHNAVKRAAAGDRLASLRHHASVGLLERMLDDPDRDVRRVAAVGLGRVGRAGSVAPLLASVTGKRRTSLLLVGDSLARIGMKAVDALVEALDSPLAAQRELAAGTLGRIGATAAAERLADLLYNDEADSVRVSAAGALSKVGTWDAVTPLRDVAAGYAPTPVRCAAIAGLAELGSAASVAMLEAIVCEPNYDVAHSAAGALARLERPGRDALTRLADSGPAWAVAHAIEALAALEMDEELGRLSLRRVLV